ncbi:MAG TPA: Rrf2 family transcriptional regulator [Dehalococcoidia bacterium]|nr:Rrf2 family transcriptional regulator [Dehalococcoidia bacterium]
MRLSTRTRYGVRALLDMAQHSDNGPVLLKDIAERQRISKDYLEHILIPLKVAGLVRTTRGVQGGFTIAKPATQIRLDEVVQILERRLALVECVDDPKSYPYSDVCAPPHSLAEDNRSDKSGTQVHYFAGFNGGAGEEEGKRGKITTKN